MRNIQSNEQRHILVYEITVQLLLVRDASADVSGARGAYRPARCLALVKAEA